MESHEVLKQRLVTEFVKTGKFRNVESMLKADSLKEMGYMSADGKMLKTIDGSNLNQVIDEYLSMNKKYLEQLLSKTPSLKNIKIDDLEQEELKHSLFVDGVGATLKKLKNHDKKLTHPSEDIIIVKKPDNSLSVSATEGFVVQPKSQNLNQNTNSQSIPDDDIDILLIEKTRFKNLVEAEKGASKIRSDGKEQFKTDYKTKFPTLSTSFQFGGFYNSDAGIKNPLVGMQGRVNIKLFDKTNLEQLAENPTISGRELNLSRGLNSGFNFSFSQRPGLGRDITIDADNTKSPKLSYLRLLDANVETKFNIGEQKQLGLKIGPNIFFNPLFESYNLLYPNGMNRCPCTGVCTIEDTKIPLVTAVHAQDIWKFPEYGQLLEAKFSSKNIEATLGFKPKGLNLDQPFADRLYKVAPSPQQLSATYTGTVSVINYNQGKESNIAYASMMVRPDAVSRYWLGTTGKRENLGYEAGIDLVSKNADAKNIGMAMLDFGITTPLKRSGLQNSVIGLNTTFGKDLGTNQAMFNLTLHAEQTLINKGILNLKAIEGAGITNFDHSTVLPSQATNAFKPSLYLGVQVNLNPGKTK